MYKYNFASDSSVCQTDECQILIAPESSSFICIYIFIYIYDIYGSRLTHVRNIVRCVQLDSARAFATLDVILSTYYGYALLNTRIKLIYRYPLTLMLQVKTLEIPSLLLLNSRQLFKFPLSTIC